MIGLNGESTWNLNVELLTEMLQMKHNFVVM